MCCSVEGINSHKFQWNSNSFKETKFTGITDGLISFYLDQLLGNVDSDLVEGLDKHTDKEASFINYLYLLT